MTRKKHNWDRQATAEARFRDARSYVTHDGHQFLFGEDVRNRRDEVYERDHGRCQECNKPVGWNEAHMHHIKGGLVGRCFCMHNLEILCRECHLLGKHVQVQW